jgi:hypothetical protein
VLLPPIQSHFSHGVRLVPGVNQAAPAKQRWNVLASLAEFWFRFRGGTDTAKDDSTSSFLNNIPLEQLVGIAHSGLGGVSMNATDNKTNSGLVIITYISLQTTMMVMVMILIRWFRYLFCGDRSDYLDSARTDQIDLYDCSSDW